MVPEEVTLAVLPEAGTVIISSVLPEAVTLAVLPEAVTLCLYCLKK